MLVKIYSLLAAVLLYAGNAAASPITYRVKSSENACFYTNIDKLGEKIAFYFAVQAGGDFDIDYYVRSPSFQLILEGSRERQGDFAFTATETGEYTFCFNNNMSTVTDKIVDFEITVENEPRSQLPVKQGLPDEATSGLEDSVLKVSSQVSQLSRTQKYFRTREHRNMATVQSTEGRIFWFALLESGAMVTMSALQVFIVRTFFSRRNSAKV